MLRSLKDLVRYSIAATDGDIGTVKDLYFDDEHWCARYIIVDTGSWLPGRRVLIPPLLIRGVDELARRIAVNLSVDQVKSSPGIETDQPVSRRKEQELAGYYGMPFYWGARFSTSPEVAEVMTRARTATAEDEPGDPALRSMQVVTGYQIQATDGSIGHVEDFIASDEAWVIRYMVVDTRNWLPGRKVLLIPEMIRTVDWDERAVHVDLSREQVKASPAYRPEGPVSREYEIEYYAHYGRPKYWI